LDAPKTVRVVSTDPASQGPFVVINEADFDSALHELFSDAPTPSQANELTEQKRGPGRPRKTQGATHGNG
jgi:hypothetical protein